jgi:hypothetical protein
MLVAASHTFSPTALLPWRCWHSATAGGNAVCRLERNDMSASLAVENQCEICLRVADMDALSAVLRTAWVTVVIASWPVGNLRRMARVYIPSRTFRQEEEEEKMTGINHTEERSTIIYVCLP